MGSLQSSCARPRRVQHSESNHLELGASRQEWWVRWLLTGGEKCSSLGICPLLQPGILQSLQEEWQESLYIQGYLRGIQLKPKVPDVQERFMFGFKQSRSKFDYKFNAKFFVGSGL